MSTQSDSGPGGGPSTKPRQPGTFAPAQRDGVSTGTEVIDSGPGGGPAQRPRQPSTYAPAQGRIRSAEAESKPTPNGSQP